MWLFDLYTAKRGRSEAPSTWKATDAGVGHRRMQTCIKESQSFPRDRKTQSQPPTLFLIRRCRFWLAVFLSTAAAWTVNGWHPAKGRWARDQGLQNMHGTVRVATQTSAAHLAALGGWYTAVWAVLCQQSWTSGTACCAGGTAPRKHVRCQRSVFSRVQRLALHNASRATTPCQDQPLQMEFPIIPSVDSSETTSFYVSISANNPFIRNHRNIDVGSATQCAGSRRAVATFTDSRFTKILTPLSLLPSYCIGPRHDCQ